MIGQLRSFEHFMKKATHILKLKSEEYPVFYDGGYWKYQGEHVGRNFTCNDIESLIPITTENENKCENFRKEPGGMAQLYCQTEAYDKNKEVEPDWEEKYFETYNKMRMAMEDNKLLSNALNQIASDNCKSTSDGYFYVRIARHALQTNPSPTPAASGDVPFLNSCERKPENGGKDL